MSKDISYVLNVFTHGADIFLTRIMCLEVYLDMHARCEGRPFQKVIMNEVLLKKKYILEKHTSGTFL